MTKDKRKMIKLNPEVYKFLSNMKDQVHDHASKRRVPLTWNEFFMIVSSDYFNGRFKCHCGHQNDCAHCMLMKKVEVKLVEDQL